MKTNFKLFGLLALVSTLLSSCSYNTMVSLDEGVTSQWAQVENVYQRRSDVIGNLVATVKGYANFEKDVLVSVTEARAKATATTIDASKLTPENVAKFQEAQEGLSSAVSRLLVSVERYPDLKANQNFLELQAEIVGANNRITVERQKFNEITKEYNTKIRSFPSNLTAGMFGFEKKGYFEAEKGAEKNPEIDFSK